MKYEQEALSFLPELARHRQALHQIPELGNAEHKTHDYLWQALEALEPDEMKTMVGTGIRVLFRGNGTGRTIAFRSDMDALPITEPDGCPFASRHPGKMHACGHDGHMATLLVFAHWLSRNRARLRDTVVLLFQPAEETTRVADRMVLEGALEEPHVQAVYGMHMMPDVPLGKLATCEGPLMAQTSEIDFIIKGVASHGASPHLGRDAVSAMGHLITLLQTTVARSVDPCQQALITIGKVRAGEQRNILASEARMEGIVRTFSNEVYADLEEKIRKDARGIEEAFGVQVKVKKHIYYPCVTNDKEEFERARAALSDRFVPARPRMIAEDFAFYQLHRPGVFFFCGCMDENHTSALHSAGFGFDERALCYGLAAYCGLTELEGDGNGHI